MPWVCNELLVVNAYSILCQTGEQLLLPQRLLTEPRVNLPPPPQIESVFYGDTSGSVLLPTSHPPPSNRRFSARIVAPFGLVKGGLSVRVKGWCFKTFEVDAAGDLEEFEALGGHRCAPCHALLCESSSSLSVVRIVIIIMRYLAYPPHRHHHAHARCDLCGHR